MKIPAAKPDPQPAAPQVPAPYLAMAAAYMDRLGKNVYAPPQTLPPAQALKGPDVAGK